MSMESINNIKALTKIQLRQNKRKFILLLSVILILFLYSEFNFLLNNHGNSSYFIKISPLKSSYFLLIFCYISFSALNIITNKRISIFPGTNSSRFISRIVSDLIMMISTLVLAFVLYCTQYLILFILQQFGRDMNIHYAFDIKYGLYGILYLLSYFLLVYSICAFLGVLYSKLKIVRFFISYSIFIVGFILLIKMNVIEFSYIISFFTAETDIGVFLLKTWSIAFIVLFISFQVVLSIKIMETEESEANLIFAPVIIFIFLGAISNTAITTNNIKTDSIYNYKNDYICNKQIVSYYGNIKKLPTNFRVTTLNDAKRAGFVDTRFTLATDEVLAISFMPDTKCEGKHIYANYLDNLHITYKSPEFHYEIPQTKTIINFPFGDTYKFISGYEISKDDYLDSYSNRNDVVVFLVTNE